MGHMNEEIRDQWAAALESGEYKQGHEALVTVSPAGRRRYCCLAVLCEMAVKAGVDMTVTVIDGHVEYDGEAMVVPRAVADWAGLDRTVRDLGASGSCNIRVPVDGDTEALYRAHYQIDPLLDVTRDKWSLAEANDHGGDFPLIATVIRRHL